MNHWPDETDEEVAALTARRSSIHTTDHPTAPSAPPQAATFSIPTPRRASTGWDTNVHIRHIQEGFASNIPPTPGDFHGNIHGRMIHPGPNPMMHPPPTAGAMTSQNTRHLDPHPERLLGDVTTNAHHMPYSNYETIMSSLGQFRNNSLSYGQALRMAGNSYVERERQMLSTFGNFGVVPEEPVETSEAKEAETKTEERSMDANSNQGSNTPSYAQFQESFPTTSSTNNATSRPSKNLTQTSPKRTLTLKEWRELRKPSPTHDDDIKTLTPERRTYIEKCLQVSHAILSKINSGLRKHSNNNGEQPFDLNEDWEPRPSDIASEYISITEEVIDDNKLFISNVDFDVLTNFNWEDSSWAENEHEEWGILRAVGRLLFELFTEGETFPNTVATAAKTNETRGRSGSKDSQDGIMEMLRILTDGEGSDDGDELSVKMKNAALPRPLCRLICDLCRPSDNMTLTDVLVDLRQMMESPHAFLYGSITSRWELVFGNNHMFGRKDEMEVVMNACCKVEEVDSPTAAILISGHAGAGKSRFVQEVRKSLKGRGWTFLRCKFEKAIASEPLSVIALGLDEFFVSTMPCFSSNSFMDNGGSGVECTCSKQSCPRRIIRELNRNDRVGLDGIRSLCQWMPSLKRLVKEAYPMHAEYLEGGFEHQGQGMPEQEVENLIQLLGVLLEILASACPVLFFVDDLQWADISTISLLTSLISTAGSSDGTAGSECSLLFLGACRIDDGLTKEVVLQKLLQELGTCECISLEGFDVQSLNEMMSEALCLPRRKTLPLSGIIHEKTQGMPLFVVEFVDTMLAEDLLTESENHGWEWDIDAINRKPIARGVAELLTKKLELLPFDVIKGLQVLSCFDSRLDLQGVDAEVIDVVNSYDPNNSTDLSSGLATAAKDFLVNISGTTVAFSHELIRQRAFELIPVMDRIPLLLQLITCLVTKCQMDSSGTDVFVLATVNLMNKIGTDHMANNPQQSQLFAEYNLEAGRRLMEQAKFSAALEYFHIGMSYLQGNVWSSSYYLAVGLLSNMAIASYSLGNPEDCFKQANEVIEHATTFEDKFMAYCVYIKLLGVASTDRAIEKLLYLLPFVGETIDPNAITQQLALDELMSLKQTLGGNQKDILLQLSPMTDSRILMSMKLMGLLVLYSSQQKAFLSGYLATRMIRISLQYGQCDDTVYAMSVFCSSLVYTVNDMDEAYSLAQIALSLMKNYNANQLIPRVYGLIYGTVVTIRDTQQSTLAPLLSACHLAFNRGIHEHAVLNTLIYVRQSLFGGKCIPALLDELASLTQKHEKLSQISVIKHFLAPTYNSLSVLSGIVLDEPAVLAEYAKEPTDDIIVDVIAQNELVYVRACVATVLFESIILRDFAKASEVVLNYSQFFEVTAVLELNLYFMAGLVSLHMARQTRESCWKEKGTKMLASYENWSRSNPSNYAHKYLLLKAEYHQLMGETDAAIEAYEASINSARTYQFIQDEAIACEMAAHHFGNIGEKQRTREMIQKTHDVYAEWGAKAKANSVLELLNLRYLDDTVLNTN